MENPNNHGAKAPAYNSKPVAWPLGHGKTEQPRGHGKPKQPRGHGKPKQPRGHGKLQASTGLKLPPTIPNL